MLGLPWTRLAVALAATLAAGGACAAQGPRLPWFERDHGLAPREVGELLITELRCAACHAALGREGAPPPPGPDLTEVAGRVSPDYLQRFLADPSNAQPGTKMPDVLGARSPAERAAAAEALTQFLVDATPRPFAQASADDAPLEAAEVTRGGALFETVGCVACHGDGAQLAHVAQKYGAESLADFLFQPLHARPAGRMPDMLLTRGEARAIAGHLRMGAPVERATFEARPELVARGRALFEELRCNACHALPSVPESAPFGWWGDLDATRGCLTDDVSGARTIAPHYGLRDDHRAALRTALAAPRGAPPPEVPGALATFNCLACHVRGAHGGVAPDIDAAFRTTEPDLGDQARIPPPLTDVGAKLQGDWLHKVLFDAARVRPYMLTRMPQFGEANLGHLPRALALADGGDGPSTLPVPEGDAARDARDGGRELLGNTGLACIACHDFNGTPTPGFHGLDLITTPERLKPAWFFAFCIAPGTLRPGIVMPESWPGGQAVHQGILGGDTDAQLNAIWYFLSQGRAAADPKGIRPEPSNLTVEDAVRVYRGRSGIAGFRGIAVGLPGGLNYAFNAQTGSLTGLWRGGFVSVRWDGQGAGDFRPLARAVELAQDVAFARLAQSSDPWPLRPVGQGEHPVNPDPLYPRNHGYRFRGYALDSTGTPTFEYASGDVTIEDRIVAVGNGAAGVLRRTLRLSAPAPTSLYLRVLTGEAEARSAREFATPQLSVTVPEGARVLRRSAVGEAPADLLLELALPAGVTVLSLDYALHD